MAAFGHKFFPKVEKNPKQPKDASDKGKLQQDDKPSFVRNSVVLFSSLGKQIKKESFDIVGDKCRILSLVSFVFKASFEKIASDSSLIVALAGGDATSLMFFDSKSLEHYERNLHAKGSLNDFSVDHQNHVIMVTSNDGKLYKINLNAIQSAEDEEDDFMDPEGDDGEEVDIDPEDEDNADANDD